MNNYVLFADVTVDLSEDMFREIDVTSIPMPFYVNDKIYNHYPDLREMTIDDFYERMRNGEKPSTTQINVETYIQYFKDALEKGNDLLYICFSSGLSGTLQSANIAISVLREQYPERTIRCIDSLCASAGGGMFVYYAAQKKKEGLSIDELTNWAENQKLHLCHWFTVEDLMFLHRGGRLSKTAALAGSVLHIMPILHVDNDGHLILVDKVRGRRKALETLATKMFKTAIDLSNQTIFISHGDSLADAQYLEKYIKDNSDVKNIIISPVDPIIGSHSGPGTIALFFWGNER